MITMCFFTTLLTYAFLILHYLLQIIDLRSFLNNGKKSNVTVYTNHVFLKKHLLKKRSPLNIVYFGIKCNNEHPRIDCFAYSTIILFILCMFLSVFVIIYRFFCPTLNLDIISAVFLVLSILTHLISLLIVTIESKKTQKEENSLSAEEFYKIRDDIEKEWPKFFEEKTRKQRK